MPIRDKFANNRYSVFRWWVPRIILILVLISAATLILIYKQSVISYFKDFVEWSKVNTVISPFVFMLANFTFVLMLGGQGYIATAAGYALNHAYTKAIFTVIIAAASTFTGAWTAAICSFILGRYLCRRAVHKLASTRPRLRAIETSVERQGLKIICLIRFSIIVPFGISNYLLGASSVSFKDFALGTLAILPSTILHAYIGTTISNIEEALSTGNSLSTRQLIFIVVSTVISIVALAYGCIIVKRTLDKEIELNR